MEILKKEKKYYPFLISSFEKWLSNFRNPQIIPEGGELEALSLNCENKKIYGNLETKEKYIQSILDYISGMTDQFAIKVFTELLTY